jgi:REP element-mobilizing transposase RayT
MVVAHHLIWTVYGWWLPNDPRGSMSRDIRVEPIADLGPIHYERKPVQPSREELRHFHELARDVLKHDVLLFSTDEIQVLGRLIGKVINDRGYTCYACAVMPEHIHLLIRRHRDNGDVMLEALQQATRQGLIDAEIRSPRHPVWGGKGWDVFLNTRANIERIIEYIQKNPLKAGMPAQHWRFVKPYDGWIPGLSPKRK